MVSVSVFYVVWKRIGHESVKGGKKIGVGAKGSGISLSK